MQITCINIKKQTTEENKSIKAYATVVLYGEVAIHDIKIIEGSKGIFVAFPSRKRQNGEFIDVVHPINNEARSKIVSAIMDAYNNMGEFETITVGANQQPAEAEA